MNEDSTAQELILASSLMVPQGTKTTDPPKGLFVTLVAPRPTGLEFRVEERPAKASESSASNSKAFDVQRISIDSKYTVKTYYATGDGEPFVLEHYCFDPAFLSSEDWWDQQAVQAKPFPWKLHYKRQDYQTAGKVELSPLINATGKSSRLSVAVSRAIMNGGMVKGNLHAYFYPLFIDTNTAEVEYAPPNYFTRMHASCNVTNNRFTHYALSMLRFLDSIIEVKLDDRFIYIRKLRSVPGTVSIDEIRQMISERNLRDTNYADNPNGDFPNEYEIQTYQGDKVVIDHASGLMWQHSGSEALQPEEIYINSVNQGHYAGHSDWRLPTIEELTSLIEPRENARGLHLDPIFDINHSFHVSSDKVSGNESMCWGVSFSAGYVIGGGQPAVLAVRNQ